MSSDSPRLRLGIVGIVTLSLFAALFARLWFLQVMASPEFRVQADTNRVRVIPQQAPRGRILDRNGKVIVDNRTSVVVTIDRQLFAELEDAEADRVLERLAEEFTRYVEPTTTEQIEERLSDVRFSPFTPVPVAEDVPETLEVYLLEHTDEFPTIAVDRVAVREYPFGSLAAHLLGYVGAINQEELDARRDRPKTYQIGDEIGKTGAERIYEDDLRGAPGSCRLEVDADGKPIRVLDCTDPVPGDDLVLTLDIDIQAVAETSLVQGLEDARGRPNDNGPTPAPAGSVVVLDPRDGAVRAMASFPTYDPADFVNGISTQRFDVLTDPANHFPLNNRAIQGQYAPGSTFKLITAYAGLSTGLIGAGTTVHDTGVFQIPGCTGGEGGGCTRRNAGSRAYGTVDLRRALTVSSDVYFYTLGAGFWTTREKYGEEAIQTAARDFGLAAKTGIPLPSEQAGRIPTPENRREAFDANPDLFLERNWFTGDNINVSIGQGDVLVTPLQLANAYATLANGGTLYAPNVADRVLGSGTTDAEEPTVVRTLQAREIHEVEMPPAWRDPIMDGLSGVTTEVGGTARSVFADFPSSLWPVVAKTGTAQVTGKADTAVFAAFGPRQAPEYVVVAILEESGFGGVAAAPVVRRVIDVVSGHVPLPAAPLGGRPIPPDQLPEAPDPQSGTEVID